MPATSRLALPYPASSDPPDGPAQIQALAQALDNASIDLVESTAALRPPPSIRGRWHYATDTGVLSRDSGSTWRTLQQMLGTDVITATNLAADSVGTSELAPLAVTNAEVATAAAIAESKLALASDAAAGTASRRTLGAGALQAMPGNATPTPGDGTVTVAKTGTGDNGLARGSFHAYRSAALAGLATGATLLFDTEEWDISGWYTPGSGTFLPLIAGVYRLSTVCSFTGLVNGKSVVCELRKNGVTHRRTNYHYTAGGASQPTCVGSWLVQANGVDDDFVMRVVHDNATGIDALNVDSQFFFEAELIGRS